MDKPRIVSSYTRAEQETSANFNQGEWIIYSSRTPHMTKLLKQYPNAEIIEQTEEGNPAMVRVVLDSDLISFRKPVSEDRKKEMSKKAKERGFGGK